MNAVDSGCLLKLEMEATTVANVNKELIDTDIVPSNGGVLVSDISERPVSCDDCDKRAPELSAASINRACLGTRVFICIKVMQW